MNVSPINSKQSDASKQGKTQLDTISPILLTKKSSDLLSDFFSNDAAINLPMDDAVINFPWNYVYDKYNHVYTRVYEVFDNQGCSSWHREECLPDEVEDLGEAFADFDEDSKYYFNP